MHAYLLALEIEPVEVGRVYVALPLHCTIMHWFRSERSPADILKAITPVIDAQEPFTLESGTAAMFGLEKDVPVNQIANETEVRVLHEKLLEALKPYISEDIAPQWRGNGYSPHVTRQRSGRFEEGRKVLVNRLYLAEAMAPDQLQQKKIIDKYFMHGNSK